MGIVRNQLHRRGAGPGDSQTGGYRPGRAMVHRRHAIEEMGDRRPAAVAVEPGRIQSVPGLLQRSRGDFGIRVRVAE